MDSQQLQGQRLQLVTTLTTAAESLRNAAAMVDGFAANLQQTPLAPNDNLVGALTPMSMLQTFAQMFNTGALNQPISIQQPPASSSTNASVPTANGAHKGSDPAHARSSPDSMLLSTDGPPAAHPQRKRKRVDDDDKKAKKEKGKKVKDPNAPKRPASAYILFQNDVREEMRKSNPGMPYNHILMKISDAWAALTEEDKRPYVEQVNKGKIKYEKEKVKYEAKQLGVPGGDEEDTSTSASPADAVSPESPAEAISEASSDEEEKTAKKEVKKVKVRRMGNVDAPETPVQASTMGVSPSKEKKKEKKRKSDA